MGKYGLQENDVRANAATLQQLLDKTDESVSGRIGKESTSVYMDDDDDKTATDGGIINGKTLLSLNTITPNNPSTYLFRNKFSSKMSRRGVRKRVIFKNGDCNVMQENVAKRRRRYLADIFTTLVDIQWRYNLMVFSMGFILSWLGFAIIWWLICFTHGDLEHVTDETWIPCVKNLHSFTSAFLFSIETQHTIGYGSRYTTEECPEAIFIMCIQSIAGVMIQAFMVGVVFAKLSRPKKRAQTLLFSRNAIVSLREGKLCLMFRVGDMRKSHIIEAHVQAQIIKTRVTAEGETLQHHLQTVTLGADSCNMDGQIFFIWPATIVHVIDENSPFYNLSARDLLRENFELVVILEGCIESTGMTTQARSSYLPSEILWGHRFESLVTYRKETGGYEVDYSRFNNTYEVETPLCSAAELIEYQKQGHCWKKYHQYKKKSITPPVMKRSKSLESLKGVENTPNDNEKKEEDKIITAKRITSPAKVKTVAARVKV